MPKCTAYKALPRAASIAVLVLMATRILWYSAVKDCNLHGSLEACANVQLLQNPSLISRRNCLNFFKVLDEPLRCIWLL